MARVLTFLFGVLSSGLSPVEPDTDAAILMTQEGGTTPFRDEFRVRRTM